MRVTIFSCDIFMKFTLKRIFFVIVAGFQSSESVINNENIPAIKLLFSRNDKAHQNTGRDSKSIEKCTVAK